MPKELQKKINSQLGLSGPVDSIVVEEIEGNKIRIYDDYEQWTGYYLQAEIALKVAKNDWETFWSLLPNKED
jgi:hypothetical protein